MRRDTKYILLLFMSLNIFCSFENPEDRDKEQDQIAKLVMPAADAARESAGSPSDGTVYPAVGTNCRSEYTVLVTNTDFVNTCIKCHDSLLAVPAKPLMEDTDISYLSAILLINPGSVVTSVFYQTVVSTWHTSVTTAAANQAIIDWISKCNPQL